ncbi:hypothetical protein AUK40_00820 [Candidatus Wirthbacteria bacterium CG2_30_54_11]|uniref:Uncharacterized protein n=1 Tax=Candidatus Wirthbacteria bacterium CG2_30_54_11 TaxID=1817892 RepID=A0A1J5IPZ6_9BACT|nr:MAG: hypothetical protein AUK40_00820 [Candidatus Wirthbacteria bacterium CG2_30_54_11]
MPTIAIKKNRDGRLETGEAFGIEAVIEQRPHMMSQIIARGSRLPASASKRYFPVEDDQTHVKVICYKGDNKAARDNTRLGEFTITGLKARTRENSKGVDVTFTINQEGVVLVDALEVENPENHLKIKLSYVQESLLKSVAKGVVREIVGILLPSNKR